MNLFDILEKEISIFSINDIEDKKTKSLIEIINKQLSNITSKFEEFNQFASSQLNGEYNHKIAMAKSLNDHYEGWVTTSNACSLLKKEEENAINKFYSEKNSLIENLKTLLKDSQRLPVVSSFDIYDDSYFQLRPGHPVIILGNNNTIVIDKLINDLENNFIVNGNYDEISPIELHVNYSNLDSNAKMCREKIEDLFYNKRGKSNKLTTLAENMSEIGEKLVFFATFRKEMENIGCNKKELDLFEKDLLKKYIPLKKHLQKALKFQFTDICDINVDENEYYNEETPESEYDTEETDNIENKFSDFDTFINSYDNDDDEDL